jgi:Holliday junction resolvasome RuvABC endonuclease subunit
MKIVETAPANFCAVDACTNSLAFAYFVNHKLDSYGKIKFNGANIYEKLGDTAHKTKAFFEAYPVQNIVIEKTIFANSPLVAANLALSQGSLVGAAQLGGVRGVWSVAPIAWQSYIGTKLLSPTEKAAIKAAHPGKSASWYKNTEREVRKQMTILTVNEKFGTMVQDNDVADAMGIGIYCLENWHKVVKE